MGPVERAREWVADYASLLDDEQSISADLNYFFEDEEPRTIGMAIHLFQVVRDELRTRAPKRGTVLIVPLHRREQIEVGVPAYAEVIDRLWEAERMPTIYMTRRSVFDRFELLEELRIPLKWEGLGKRTRAWVRTWRSDPDDRALWQIDDEADMARLPYESALYFRSFPGEGKTLGLHYGVPAIRL